jgi:large-conductance mechanosensitive channel
MKSNTSQKFLQYMYSNFTGNFVGFAIGMASTRLVSHFFTTRSIKNLWGLTTSKTVVDKQTFSGMEWAVSIIIGFVVFEIISKWVKKKLNPMLVKYKGYLPADWVDESAPATGAAVQPVVAATIKQQDKTVKTGSDSAA